MRDYAVAFGLVLVVGAMLLAAPRLLVGRAGGKVNARMLTHLLSGLLAVAMVLLVDDKTAVLVAGASAVPGLIVAVELGLLGSMQTGSRLRDYGFVAYAVGFVACVAAYFPDNRAIIAGLLTLAIADPVAAAVGRRVGRRPVRVFGARRTLEGSAAFAAAAFAVAVTLLAFTESLTPATVGLALFLAGTSAALELIVPGAADNLLIPLWVGFAFHAEAAGGPRGLAWAAAFALAALLAIGIARAGWLTTPGAAAAFLTGAAALAFGGVPWIVPVLVFLATTSVLSKINAEGAQATRGLEQTVVNGLLPMLPVLAYQVTGGWVWYAVHVGAVVVASADTWASEIGRLAGRTPVSLRNLKPARKGTSGAVTLPGSAASLVGAGVVGLAAAALAPAAMRLDLLLVALVVGPLGMLVDSLLGAWLQCRYACRQCAQITEHPSHCRTPASAVSGLPGLTNERVNLTANAVGALLAAGALAVLV